jgi:hypothetical protein
MEITVTPDTYSPIVDEFGNYIDKIPVIRNGLFCPCGSRKDKIYENTCKFASHIKSKSHQKWLQILKQNKANYYVEMCKNKELVENQQKIIIQLENQLQKKSLIIDYLTEQLTAKTNRETCSIDLLDFN